MKKHISKVFEFWGIQNLKNSFIHITIFCFIFLLTISNKTYSQTIPDTGSIVTPCGDCTPTGWFDFEPGSTPDISNKDFAGGQGTNGGLATWFAAPLPLPPTGASTWITMKDLGNYPGTSEESVSTTMGGIISGKVYRLTIYTMGAISNQNGDASLTDIPGDVGTGAEYYGGTYKTKFNYQIGKNAGDLQPEQVVSGVTQNVWGKSFFYFAGDPDVDGTMRLNILTGEYSGWDGTNRVLIEPLHIAVELNGIEELDSDGDGVPDTDDIDDDNDGILDTDELTIGGITYDPLGDEDGDLLPNYLDIRDDGDAVGYVGNTDYNDLNADGIPDKFDSDRDGIPNHLDLDADNDGIPDIIEGQTTTGYIAPNGVYGANGLDSAYEGGDDSGSATSYTITNTDSAHPTDSDTIPDYLDLDSDGDGTSDEIEANSFLTYEFGENGLDSAYDNGDDYADPNGSFDNTQIDNFPNTSGADSPDDVNWRDTDTTVGKDTDGDGILDSSDIDDDNDGIPDVNECSTLGTTASDNAFGYDAGNSVSITNPTNSYNGNTANYAVLDNEDDILVIDLDDPGSVPNNTIVYIHSSVTTNINHTMRVEQSSDGITYSNQKVFTWTATTTGEDKEYRLDADANFIRIKLDLEDGGELRVHNVSFDGFEIVCDFDGDGIPNHLDLDSDNDGIPDNIEAQITTNYKTPSGVDTDNDGLDDAYDTGCAPCGGITGVDLSSPNNHDGTGEPDYLDTDSDDDGTSDRIEANLSLSGSVGSNGLDSNYDNGDNYADVNGNFDTTPFDDFPDNPSGGEIDWRDNTSVFSDNDNDGIPDSVDLDDDNDGILDSVEDANIDLDDDPTTSPTDTDGDGIPNHFDLDSDNDGIPDNIESQTTNGYEIPDGIEDVNGVDTAYTGGNTPVDTDGDGTPDYLELDSDNDGILDNTEAGVVLTGVYGNNGLDNAYDNGDNYVDVNGSFDGSQTDNFPDDDNDVFSGGDVDYRDNTFTIDTDGDGVNDEVDLDDDNDGILDTTEQSTNGDCVGADKTLDWGDTNEFGGNTTTEDPTTLNSGVTTESKVDITLTRTTTVGSNSTYLIGNSAVSNSTDAYILIQRAASGANSRQIFTFKAPVKDLAFTIYDIDEDNGAGGTSKDKVEIIITQQDGSNYTMVSGTDYTVPAAAITELGSNTFEANNGDTGDDLIITSIPVYVSKIQIVYTNTGSGSISNNHSLAIGNFTYCAPLDSDNDGIFDYLDLDADNDGIPDNIEAQTTADYIEPSGSYSVTGIDLAYGMGLTPEDTDTDLTPDYLDLDSDGDATNDINEGIINEALPANSGGRFTGNVGANGLLDALEATDTDQGYTDVNGIHVNPKTDGFLDDATDSDVLIGGDLDYRDDLVGVDTDDDGIVNTTDIDDDNDGIIDTVESGGFDPLGDDDGDSILNYLDIFDNDVGGPATTDYTDANGDGYPDVYHADSDGVPNHLDIDADNDGIPDNVEGQNTRTTGAGTLYIAPSGSVGTNGLYDIYETVPDNGISNFTPVNTDSGVDAIPDYLDLDSDNDGKPDIQENGDSDNTISGTDTDGDGLDDNFEGSDNNDGYDVNDEINIPQADLPDEDSDVATQDVDYRDTTTGTITPGSAGNILWLRADKDVTDDEVGYVGQEVSSWIDQTNAFDATSPTGTAPDKIDIGLNFNPVIDFDDANEEDLDILTGILGAASYENLWSYVVVNPNTAVNSFVFVENMDSGNFHVKTPSNGISTIRQRYGGPNGSNTVFESTPADYLNNYSLYTFGSTTTPLTSPTGDNQANHQLGRVLNSSSIGNSANVVTRIGANDNMSIGSNPGGSNRYWNGQIAEIMIFNETPTALKQQSVESYLAIKYGFTLSSVSYSGGIVEGDYILADQTTKVWDYTANSSYHNNVIGIGRDDAMALTQYQSKSSNPVYNSGSNPLGPIITIGLTTIADSNENNVNFGTGFTTNKDFLVVGHDTGVINTTTDTELICAPEKTIGRTWKIVENGAVGSVQIAANKGAIDGALSTPFTIKALKVADDAAFTTNISYVPLTDTTINGENVYEANYDFNGTKYFTYSEINGIFWNGGETLLSDRWSGGNNSGKPTTNAADENKVMVIDAQGTDNHPTLTEDAIVECVWIKAGSKLMVADNKYLEFDEDFILDGEIRLVDNGQLIQTHDGLSNVQGNGKLYRDQAAKVPSVYRYHYWTSPVRELNLNTFRVGEVMKDGNIATSETSSIVDIDWVSGYDGDDGTPIKIAPYWIYTYLNGTSPSNWVQQYQTGAIKRGQGFTMKSTGENPQNFTFVGTPNDGSITFPISPNASSLLGNPYPSALDSYKFISLNLSAIDGTLYFWEHTGEDGSSPSSSEGHNLTGYQGGYSQRNLSMGIAASSVPAVDPFVFDWEDATDLGATITQTVEGFTATVSTNSGSLDLEDNIVLDEPDNNVITNNGGLSTHTVNVNFDQVIDISSIYIFNDIISGSVDVTITDGINSTTVTLTDNEGQEVSLGWADITSISISGSDDYDLVIDDIKFVKGNAPSIGLGTYHAPNKYIAVAQGFFITGSNSGGTIRFENKHREFETDIYVEATSGDNGTGTYFFKGNNEKKNDESNVDLLPILKLGFNHIGANNVELHRQIGISFKRSNTFNYDNGYDSEIYDIGTTDFYWHFPDYSDKKLIIAGVPEIKKNLEVPLTIKLNNSSSFSIEIDAIKNIDRDIFIEDKLLGEFYKLTKDTPLELSLEKGTYTDRFYLTFNNSSDTVLNTEENLLNKELTIFMNNNSNQVIIKNQNNLEIKKIALFNLLGQKVNLWKDLENKSLHKLKVNQLSSSVYVLKIQTEKGTITKKIMIE